MPREAKIIVRIQAIFPPPPGARVKMISLFMTVTWLAGVDGIFIFTSCLWGLDFRAHSENLGHVRPVGGLAATPAGGTAFALVCAWGGVLVGDPLMCCVSGPRWGSRL